jgi:hypothetical protein
VTRGARSAKGWPAAGKWRGHFLRVVRGEDLYLCAMLGGEAAQPGLVVAACLPVGRQDGLEQSQAGWRARVHGVNFAVEEVRVAGMQEPLRAGSGRCLGTDRHGSVAAGVPGKGDEQLLAAFDAAAKPGAYHLDGRRRQ